MAQRHPAGDGPGTEFEPVLAAAQAGAPWALEVLYRALQPSVLGYLRCHEPGSADDLASETWLGVAGGIKRFSGDEDGFRGWVFTIARRRLTDLRRSRGRRRTAPVAPTDLERPASGDVAAQVVDDLAGQALLGEIAGILSPEQLEIVSLRVLAGLDVDAVAEIVSKRPGTVRVIQHRALKRLAEQFGDSRNATPTSSDVEV